MQEPNEDRRKAYLEVKRNLVDGERPIWPLSFLEMPVPRGHSFDLLNRFIGTAIEIRWVTQGCPAKESTNEGISMYEIQAQICYEPLQQLSPKEHGPTPTV